jgi:predicted DNA-binding protein
MAKLLTVSLNKKYEYLLKDLHKISNETGKPISRLIVEAIENYIKNLNPENMTQGHLIKINKQKQEIPVTKKPPQRRPLTLKERFILIKKMGLANNQKSL